MAEVSVIVPVYGVEKYIVQCLESIRNQTFTDIEVILVDDGSPDNCPAICDDYASRDPRFKVIHKENGGVSLARNTGIEQAGGKWMYIVDSDDWLELDAIEKLHTEANEQRVDCVITDCVEHYSNGAERRLHMFSQTFRTEEKEMITTVQKSILCHKYSPYFSLNADNEYPAPWSKFFKSSIVLENNIQFNPYVMGQYDDGVFTMYLLDHVKSLYYDGNHTYNYRIVAQSITRKFKKNMLMCNIRNCELLDRFMDQTKKDQDFRQAEYCRRVSYFAALLSGYFFAPSNPAPAREVKKELRSTLKNYPYDEAFKKARFEHLERKHQYVLLCGKMRFIYGLKLYARLKLKYRAAT